MNAQNSFIMAQKVNFNNTQYVT